MATSPPSSPPDWRQHERDRRASGTSIPVGDTRPRKGGWHQQDHRGLHEVHPHGGGARAGDFENYVLVKLVEAVGVYFHDVVEQPTGVSRIGSLDGRLVVYRDTFETRDQLIIGYKGPSEYDTGVIYLPYIQLLASKAVFENSFHPTVGLMSRYAIHNHMFGAREYYQKINLTNIPQ